MYTKILYNPIHIKHTEIVWNKTKEKKTMRIRQQRTRQINISKKMMLICLCMILMVSIAGCGGKKKENLTITNVSYDPKESFMKNIIKILLNIIKTNMVRK